MKLSMLPEKRIGAIWVSAIFSKLPQRKFNLDNISSSNLHRIISLVSTPMFSWSKNRMKPLIKRLGHSYNANLEKMFYDKIKKYIYKQIQFANIP